MDGQTFRHGQLALTVNDVGINPCNGAKPVFLKMRLRSPTPGTGSPNIYASTARPKNIHAISSSYCLIVPSSKCFLFCGSTPALSTLCVPLSFFFDCIDKRLFSIFLQVEIGCDAYKPINSFS